MRRPAMRRPLWMMIPAFLLRIQSMVIVGGVVILFAAAVLIAAVVGQAGTTADFQLAFAEDCPPPCWQGLHPGEMTLAEARQVIVENGLQVPGSLLSVGAKGSRFNAQIEWQTRAAPAYQVNMRFTSERLMRVDLYPLHGLTVGDVLSVLGAPSDAYLCQVGGQFSPTLLGTLYFADGMVEVQAVRQLSPPPAPSSGFSLATVFPPLRDHREDWFVSPATPVLRITYRVDPLGLDLPTPLGASPWAGFGQVRLDGYCH